MQEVYWFHPDISWKKRATYKIYSKLIQCHFIVVHKNVAYHWQFSICGYYLVLSNSNLVKSCLTTTYSSVGKSLWNFAQSIVVSLLCLVQNFETIWRQEWMLWVNRILLHLSWGEFCQPGLGVTKQKSMLNSMLVNKDFLTWLLIGWQLCCQPTRCQVWKSLLTNLDFNMEIAGGISSIVQGCFVLIMLYLTLIFKFSWFLQISLRSIILQASVHTFAQFPNCNDRNFCMVRPVQETVCACEKTVGNLLSLLSPQCISPCSKSTAVVGSHQSYI